MSEPPPGIETVFRTLLDDRIARADDDRCVCFGDTGFQASTHVDREGVERCDLCGLACRDQDPWNLAGASRPRTAIALLALGAVLCAAAAVVVSRDPRR